MTYKPNAISLFSGMGGDTLAIQNAGFNIIAFIIKNRKINQLFLLQFILSMEFYFLMNILMSYSQLLAQK